MAVKILLTTDKKIVATLLGVSALMLIAANYLYYLMPATLNDPIMVISPVFSFLRGYPHQSIFAHSNVGDYLYPPVLSIIAYPFFKYISPSVYSLKFFHLLIIISNLILMFLVLKREQRHLKWVAFVTFGYVCSGHTDNMRYENIGILLILLALFIDGFRLNFLIRNMLVSLLVALAGILHPVAGVVGVLVLLLYYITQKRSKEIIYFLFGVIISAYLVSSGKIFEYVKYVVFHEEASNHTFKITLLPYYIILNSPMAILFAVTLYYKRKQKRFWIITTICFIVFLCLFGRSYYLVYALLLILLMHLDEGIETGTNIVLLSVPAFFVSFWFIIVLPTVQIVENPDYRFKLKEILMATRKHASAISSPTMIWVPGSVSMNVIDLENSRFHAKLYKSQSSITDGLGIKTGDYIFIDNPGDKVYVKEILMRNSQTITFTEVVSPVRGLLKSSSLFKTRSDSLGLWMGVIRQN